MFITKEQRLEFEDACKPLVKWLNENCHPHMTVVVHSCGAELLEGIATASIEEFLKD